VPAPTSNVTVAICTWNRADNLRATLEQLTKLSIPPDLQWELLVVNNCCTDGTDSIAQSFEGRLPVRLLHETTPGQSHARNLAIREATGSHIVWTDDDVIVDPRWLTAIVKAFEEYKADWVFGTSDPEWPGKAPGWYSDRFQGYFAALDYGPKSFVVTRADRPFYGLNCAGTRDAHLALNGFRTEFGFRGAEGGVGEDVDMFERALRAGMRIVYTPDARVRHVIPPARVRKQYHRRRQWVANRVYYRHVDEMFPKVPYFLGLPRFFYSQAVHDAIGYARSVLTGRPSDRFYYELQLLRMMGLSFEAARYGFKRPARRAPGRQNKPGAVQL
jgi:glycosyltransferase involved in cell wall biosynthesis